MRAGAPRKILAIGGTNARRFGRERMNIFFAFVMPVALILIIGLQFGGDPTPRLGVVDGGSALAASVMDALEADDEVEVVPVARESALAGRVESSDLDAGIVFPDDLDAALVVVAEGPAEIRFVAARTVAGQQLVNVVDQALARALAVPTAARLAVSRGADPVAAASAAEQLAPVVDRVAVRSVTTGDELFPDGTGGYDVAAPSQMVLFVFLTGLTGSYALIQTRQLGVSSRMMSTPTTVRSIILGEALGRLLIGVVQGFYILLATFVLFGVAWGDPLGAMAVLVTVAAVSAGAAMCFGTFFSNPDQASGVGTIVALSFAAVGGAMLPIELFGDTLASVARVTPHFWAIDAFAELIRHDGSVLDIGTQLGVLLAFAAALLVLASWRMRAVLTRGG